MCGGYRWPWVVVDNDGVLRVSIPRQAGSFRSVSRSKRLGLGPLTSGLGSHLKVAATYKRRS